MATFLLAKPLLLMKSAVLLATRSIAVVTFAWMNVVKSLLNFQANLLAKIVIWSIAFVSFPVRVLTAVQRERTMEVNMRNMQSEVENLIWENKELEKQVHMAVKDRKIIETVFAELEDDFDKALTRIEDLENELQELKQRNLQLIEVQGKSRWNYRSDNGKAYEIREGIPVGSKYASMSWSSDFDGKGSATKEACNEEEAWEDGNKMGVPIQPYVIPKSVIPGYTFSQVPIESSILDEAMEQRRASALSQSLFSAVLSLLVGLIILEAEDPCMPLVGALFIVVGMSLCSVVQFFSTIKNKPASDAVALLSFNWFILGTLTSPTLPRLARVLVPPALKLIGVSL